MIASAAQEIKASKNILLHKLSVARRFNPTDARIAHNQRIVKTLFPTISP